MARVSEGSSEKEFVTKLFENCDLKTHQRYIQQEGMKISKKELSSLVNSLREFLKIFDEASERTRIPVTIPKKNLLSKDKRFSLLKTIKIQLNIQMSKIVNFADSGPTILASVPSRIFELHGNPFKVTPIVNPNYRRTHHLDKNR